MWGRLLLEVAWAALLLCTAFCEEYQSTLSKERIVIQTKFGDIIAALYSEVVQGCSLGTVVGCITARILQSLCFKVLHRSFEVLLHSPCGRQMH